ncbi:hypothetical protein YC2023_017930 [Brassica napus]
MVTGGDSHRPPNDNCYVKALSSERLEHLERESFHYFKPQNQRFPCSWLSFRFRGDFNMERKTIDLDQGWDYMQTGATKLKRILEGLP